MFRKNRIGYQEWVLGTRRRIMQALDIIGGEPFIETGFNIKTIRKSEDGEYRELEVTGKGYICGELYHFQSELTVWSVDVIPRYWMMRSPGSGEWGFRLELSKTKLEGSWESYVVELVSLNEDEKRNGLGKVRVTLFGWGVLHRENPTKYPWKWREGHTLRDWHSEPINKEDVEVACA